MSATGRVPHSTCCWYTRASKRVDDARLAAASQFRLPSLLLNAPCGVASGRAGSKSDSAADPGARATEAGRCRAASRYQAAGVCGLSNLPGVSRGHLQWLQRNPHHLVETDRNAVGKARRARPATGRGANTQNPCTRPISGTPPRSGQPKRIASASPAICISPRTWGASIAATPRIR